ncbi:hypothetical protein [Nonomuraea aurantiaca]|uniref:hypothetical protein n=1 Tax=Nonomuraea aurantiaca TaxID=2878562 RepID=UPI001CD93A97|nr:hypothetical protein [Nonomuraea aurantiaca]MCA2230295.1 hypothetical protein [Nonomuraea aurantiaca]
MPIRPIGDDIETRVQQLLAELTIERPAPACASSGPRRPRNPVHRAVGVAAARSRQGR